MNTILVLEIPGTSAQAMNVNCFDRNENGLTAFKKWEKLFYNV